jgi:hypothetical protein
VAALLIERNPNLGPEDVRKILTSSARRLGTKDRDDDFGSGLVDPSKAIQTAGDFHAPEIATGAVASSAPPTRPASVAKPLAVPVSATPGLTSARPAAPSH